MVLTPDEALTLTPENVVQADAVCEAIDGFIRRNLTAADTVTRVPLSGPYPPRKVLGEVARRYRSAGWIGAWYEPARNGNGRALTLVLWTAFKRPQLEAKAPLA